MHTYRKTTYTGFSYEVQCQHSVEIFSYFQFVYLSDLTEDNTFTDFHSAYYVLNLFILVTSNITRSMVMLSNF
jgi:hypothetical protein